MKRIVDKRWLESIRTSHFSQSGINAMSRQPDPKRELNGINLKKAANESGSLL